MSKSLFFLIVVLIFSIVFSQLFFYQIEGHNAFTLIERFTFTSFLFVDSLLAAGLIVLLVNGQIFLRLAGHVIFVLLITIYCLQYASLYMTAEYLSPTAIANIQHIGLVLTPIKIAIISVFCLSLLVTILVAELYFKKATRKKRAYYLHLVFYSQH